MGNKKLQSRKGVHGIHWPKAGDKKSATPTFDHPETRPWAHMDMLHITEQIEKNDRSLFSRSRWTLESYG